MNVKEFKTELNTLIDKFDKANESVVTDIRIELETIQSLGRSRKVVRRDVKIVVE